MYRPNTNSFRAPFAILLLLGIAMGVGFFIYDNDMMSRSSVAMQPSMTEPQATPITNEPMPMATADVTTLFIPSAGVHAPIIPVFLDGGTWDVTGLGTRVGHLQRTAWLNQPGNIVLAGHVEMADGRKGIFATLEALQLGDSIILTDEGVKYRYAVKEVKHVAPDDLSVLYPTATRTITLITCSDYNFLSNSYDQRFIVVAEAISG